MISSVALIVSTPHASRLTPHEEVAASSSLAALPAMKLRARSHVKARDRPQLEAAASHCRRAASEVMAIGGRSEAEGAGSAKPGAAAARLGVASASAQNLTLRATGAHCGEGGGAGGLAVRHLLALRKGRDVRMAAIQASGDVTVWRRDGAVAHRLLHALGARALQARVRCRPARTAGPRACMTFSSSRAPLMAIRPCRTSVRSGCE